MYILRQHILINVASFFQGKIGLPYEFDHSFEQIMQSFPMY